MVCAKMNTKLSFSIGGATLVEFPTSKNTRIWLDQMSTSVVASDVP